MGIEARYNDPWFRVLAGNLQSSFIAPIETALRKLGCEIEFDVRVEGLHYADDRVTHVTVRDRSGATRELPLETILLSVPVEAVRDLLTDEILDRAPELAATFYLRSRPMAGMTIYFEKRLSGIPQGHINFVDSAYDLSMIDVSTLWHVKRTVLCIVASDYTPLQKSPPDAAQKHILEDLERFLPFVRSEGVKRVNLQAHVQQPLFMNSCRQSPGFAGETPEV